MMALGFCVSFIREYKDQLQPCSCERQLQERHIFPTYLKVSSRMLDSLSFSAADVFWTLGWISYFLIEGLLPQWHPRIPRSFRDQDTPKANSLCYLPLRAIPKTQALGSFLSAQLRGEWRLTAGNVDNSVHKVMNLSKVRCWFFWAYQSAQSPFVFYMWHTFPCLAKTLANFWSKGWRLTWMDDI